MVPVSCSPRRPATRRRSATTPSPSSSENWASTERRTGCGRRLEIGQLRNPTPPREIAEMCLAHVEGSASELAYRRTDYFERRRELMEAWADFVAGIDNNLGNN